VIDRPDQPGRGHQARSDEPTAGHKPAAGDMPLEDFRRYGHQIIDWIADYWAHPERHAVLPDAPPGALVDKLPGAGPDRGEPMDRILADFERQILPHVTHWNHPGFLAYFATSGSAPGVLAETLSAALNNVGLLWKASPALAELEQVTLGWLADWMGLPPGWFGMIHTTASDASLHAVIAAREASRGACHEAAEPFEMSRMVIYTSEQAHSSIEKTTLALGLGRDACRKIATDAAFRMRPDALEAAIESDRAAGLRPVCVVATVGTTSSGSVDPVLPIAVIAERHQLWLHVDAAYAGAAAILPEMREHFAGCERADSFLVNPHKWLFTPMDLSAFYTRRPELLREAFSLVPEYLRTQEDPRAVNFMEYAIPLGRRFRALKLWFILRYFGREGLASLLREHIRVAQEFARRVDEHPDFERLAPALFSLVVFRYRPAGVEPDELDRLNEKLLNTINAGGEFFLSHTKLNGRFVIRMSVGNIHTTGKHIDRLWELLLETASGVFQSAKR
jgi:aromatic-L-amino-acid/L-tryptophan decarboxylase